MAGIVVLLPIMDQLQLEEPVVAVKVHMQSEDVAVVTISELSMWAMRVSTIIL